MAKSCIQCSKEFDVTDEDREFYRKIDVPEPMLCSECRQQRRLAWRNERSLYPRKCAHTGADMISIYAPDSPWPVFSSDAWYGDMWDQLSVGRDFDFSRPFFEQYKDVQAVAPHLGVNVVGNENSPYINQGWYSKNCYMCFDLGYSENCYYCAATYYTKDSVDMNFAYDHSELCYECVGVTKCFRGIFLEDCHGCSDVSFSFDCKNCSDCILCFNLMNKQYCILNKQYSKEAYEEERKKYNFLSQERLEEIKKEYSERKQQAIHRFSLNYQCENCHGDYLARSKNMNHCFDCEKSENCAYATRIDSDVKDSMDIDHAVEGELIYEGVAMSGYALAFGYLVVHCQNVEYSEALINCNNCFGCVHLHNQEYCILNKKYSKDEYHTLREKIIEHMKKTGEWGQYFPPSIAPFGYNETTANEYYPRSKNGALAQGFRWQDDMSFITGKETMVSIPDSLIAQDLPVLTGAVLACRACGRNYKLIKQELELYLKIGVAVPRVCFGCRYMRRFHARNPHALYSRQRFTQKKETTCPGFSEGIPSKSNSGDPAMALRCIRKNSGQTRQRRELELEFRQSQGQRQQLQS